MRMVLPFSFSDIMREPICPPAKEKTAASKTNFQSIAPIDTWVKNPVSGK
jgi:hypothetical protein